MSSTYEFDPLRIAGSGEIVEGDAGATIANRDICYVGADGRYYPADSDLVATMPGFALAMFPMTVGQRGEFLVKGFIGLSTWTWTPGSVLFVSGTAGQMSHVAGTITQQVGVAFTATQIFINPASIATEGACSILEGATAYVGFNACREPFTNYFLCDGVADDVQINAAIVYVNALGGGSVFIEQGTYNYATVITVLSDVTLEGVGEDTVLRAAAASDTACIEIGVAASVTAVTVKNLRIEGNHAAQIAGLRHHGVTVEDASRVLIEGLYITGTHPYHVHDSGGSGITVRHEATDIWILRNYIDDIGDRGIQVAGSDILIQENVCANGFDRSISLDVTEPDTVRYIPNRVQIIGNIGYDNSNGSIIGSHPATAGAVGDLFDIIIQGNIGYGAHRHFLTIIGVLNVNEGNIIVVDNVGEGGAQSGIEITNGDGLPIIISGNTMSNYGTHGIHIPGMNNVIISNNGCFGNGINGILLDGSSDNVLTGNTCSGNTLNGIVLDTLSHGNAITGNRCQENTRAGINLDESDNNSLTGNICLQNVRYGINLSQSSNNSLVGNICNENDSGDTGTYDGIRIFQSDDNLVMENICNNNDRYGINIFDVTSERNWVKNNQLQGNTAGAFFDGGTDTKLATKTFSFIAGGDIDGTALWANYVSATASAKGWEVDDAADWAAALSQLPLELQQIVRFKIWAVALGAPIGAGGQMHLEIMMNAGADNLAFNTEPVALANFDGVTTDYVADDVVHWSVDSGDDADIGSMVGGMSIEVKVIYETGADPDGATNAVFRSVEIEYV